MKQKTALAQAIEKINNNNFMFELDKQYAINILQTLKPIERQQIEDFVADRNSTSNIELSIKEMFDKTLTQD